MRGLKHTTVKIQPRRMAAALLMELITDVRSNKTCHRLPPGSGKRLISVQMQSPRTRDKDLLLCLLASEERDELVWERRKLVSG